VAFRLEGENAARESTAVTDDGGHYALNYIRDIAGTAVGKHRVRIILPNWFPPSVQEKYNTKSTLREEVAAGDNKIDFHLTSK
jgi:hypothetical protein